MSTGGGGALPAVHGRQDYAVLDTVAWAEFGAIVLGYHAYLFSHVLFRRASTRLTVNFLLQQAPGWIAKFVLTPGSEVTQIQALRNTQVRARRCCGPRA
jgi:hypothetical protein